MLLAGVFALAGCDKGNDGPTPDSNAPKIEFDGGANFTVLPEGGEQSITYNIVNSVDGGKVSSAKSSESWLGSFNCDTPGTISFTSEPNESGADRSTVITVTYEYGNGESVDAQLNAIQKAWDKPLTFEIEVEPKVSSVVLNIIPSDKDAKYLALIIDESWYMNGYSDEDIMNELVGRYDLTTAYSGDMQGITVTGMTPATKYYAIAFGVDVNSRTYNSPMSKVEFNTLESQETDASVTASMDNYWDINDLSSYNPDYAGFMQNPETPVLAALDFEYNSSAVSCLYVLWTGDLTTMDQNELYDMTVANASTAYKGNPAPLYYVSYEEKSTICIIGLDAEGNYGEMTMNLVEFNESGKSTDYNLFDEYYAALMSANAAAMTQAFTQKDGVYVLRSTAPSIAAKPFVMGVR